MPRKARVSDEALLILSDTKEELQLFVKEHILPIYEGAIKKIKGMIDGTEDNLYYW